MSKFFGFSLLLVALLVAPNFAFAQGAAPSQIDKLKNTALVDSAKFNNDLGFLAQKAAYDVALTGSSLGERIIDVTLPSSGIEKFNNTGFNTELAERVQVVVTFSETVSGGNKPTHNEKFQKNYVVDMGPSGEVLQVKLMVKSGNK